MLKRLWLRKHAVAMTTYVVCPLLGALAGAVRAQNDHADHLATGTFGKVHFETSCDATVREDFDRAVAMLHSFFYPETERAFRAVIERDPSCAMAYWGVAISQRPNPLTAPFPPELLQRGWEAIQQARTTGSPTPRERAWIDALAPFFENYERVDQRTRTARYEAAMAASARAVPRRHRGRSVLRARAARGGRPHGQDLRAAAEGRSDSRALAARRSRSTPASPTTSFTRTTTRRSPRRDCRRPGEYAALAPSAPHALHMPSHIFSTLGMWPEAIRIESRRRRRPIAVMPPARTRPWLRRLPRIAGRYHALDFLTNAYLQLGQDALAKAIVDERNSTGASPAGGSITAHTGFAAIPVRYALERGAWAEAAALQPMATQFKQAEAIIWFGRALGAARLGDATAAARTSLELSRLAPGARGGGDPYWAEQVGIQEAAAERMDRARRRRRDARDRADAGRRGSRGSHRKARRDGEPALADAGAARRAAARSGRARSTRCREFERSLVSVPGRFRSIAGAATAAAAAGKARTAAKYYRELLTLAETGDGDRPALQTARAFLRRAE